MRACSETSAVQPQNTFTIIRETYLGPYTLPYYFMFLEIVPITDAVLGLKPFVARLLPRFNPMSINNILFSALFKSFHAERQKILL